MSYVLLAVLIVLVGSGMVLYAQKQPETKKWMFTLTGLVNILMGSVLGLLAWLARDRL